MVLVESPLKGLFAILTLANKSCKIRLQRYMYLGGII